MPAIMNNAAESFEQFTNTSKTMTTKKGGRGNEYAPPKSNNNHLEDTALIRHTLTHPDMQPFPTHPSSPPKKQQQQQPT